MTETETPPSLQLVEALVNTRFVERGTDELATPELAASWLVERELVPRGARVTPAEHRRVLQVRESLRAVIAKNNEGDDRGVSPVPVDAADPAAVEALAALAPRLALHLDVATEPPSLAPLAGGAVDRALASILAGVAAAVADGTWTRLKACRQPGCRWAYYDQSRNRSRAWCSMETCGNRAKARSFRLARHGSAKA